MKPQKLSWVTIPLIVMLVVHVVILLFLPLFLPLISALIGSDPTVSSEDAALVRVLSGGAIAVAWVVVALEGVLAYFTYRAVNAGKSWGRIVAIIFFIMNIFSFPVGTALGVFGLIGAFDPEVQAYTRH